MCISVPVAVDSLVECDEQFSIVLGVLTTGTSISTGNNVTAVTLVDSEGIIFVTPL